MSRSEFLDKAADHLNGNLSPQDQVEFDAYLRANQSAQRELANLEAMRETLARQVEEETDTAWAAMRTRLQSESAASLPSGWQALWRRWRMRLSLFAAITVALVEAMLLLNAPVYRSVQVDEDFRQIQVVFAPEAQQRQVRELIDQVHAQISAGPGPSGEYTLRLPAEEMDTALSTLRAAPFVQDAYPASAHP